MRGMSRGDFLRGRRSEIIEADAVTCNGSEQFAFRWGAVSVVVLAWRVIRRIDSFPGGPPHRIDTTGTMENQFTDVTPTFKNRDMAPTAVNTKARPAIQDVRMMNYVRWALVIRQFGASSKVV